mgnify:CR=1 FL=1
MQKEAIAKLKFALRATKLVQGIGPKSSSVERLKTFVDGAKKVMLVESVCQ